MGEGGEALLSPSGKDKHRSLIIPRGKTQDRTKVHFNGTMADTAPQAHPGLEVLFLNSTQFPLA